LNVVFLGEVTERLGIGEMFMFHEELGRITAFAAAETFEDVACGVHVKRARFFVMEGA